MEAQSPPCKIARVAENGIGSMGAGSPSVGLGLGLGLGPGLSHGKSGFTFLQLQELEHQALIFKYMVAGVPVPVHLVLPIWKSVVSSYGGVNGGIYQHYPSFLGCTSLCLDYRNSMEPEPGRCRRTDGKKWRCTKDVVPDQKYCERHMHRGRKCSRKHVEASQGGATPPCAAAAASSVNATTSKTNNDSLNSNTNLSISIPANLELTTTTTTTNTNTNNNNDVSGSNTSNNISNSNAGINVSPSLGFSPKSVLQSGTCKTDSSL
ncbi:PREDICTED: growth-regulating factor 10 [Nelumbo nucifera]|uniref:Growth-regulating factor n=2 Tax=Nelumbo nucifera TaxID=4432 RepID=A0A822YQ94_NELNU|nr:PREDICTED: growth-regulating factor 10 [Nelumbo nucifera]DAD33781.1 TPA_asm: hypothetical protein HUJ06_012632 [Nelumbo nucifera]